jgi:hypothetical protein
MHGNLQTLDCKINKNMKDFGKVYANSVCHCKSCNSLFWWVLSAMMLTLLASGVISLFL